ncbi:hypothetical protein MMC25_005294 [Agyrium rufum]|nr:hypothetical protein [Agyrium rufum]
MANRGFQEVNVALCSALKAVDRKEDHEDTTSRPASPPLFWRNNLTALSQRQNIYFVAYAASIHVYKPTFPSQTLGSRPVLIIRLPRSTPHRSGWISEWYPHAVNRVLVDNLGHEEILLCACDDGDVIGYYVKAIAGRISFDRNSAPSGSSINNVPKPFFMKNVGQSAWGLAVHTAARLIAVSANSLEITVFGFAIASPEHSDDNDDDEDRSFERVKSDGSDPGIAPIASQDPDSLGTGRVAQPFDPEEEAMISARYKSRHNRDWEIVLYGHTNNIPNITFAGSECDPDARYLVSIDIEQDKQSMGWSVLCLNHRTFRMTDNTVETFGCKPVTRKGLEFDISHSRSSVKEDSLWHPLFGQYSSVPNIAGRGNHSGVAPRFFQSMDLQRYSMLLDTYAHHRRNEVMENDLEEDLESDEEEDAFNSLGNAALGIRSEQEYQPGQKAHRLRDRYPSMKEKPPEHLPFSIISTTRHDLFYHPKPLESDPRQAGSTRLSAILKQHLTPAVQHLARQQRLNMSTQIPELGLVIIASQEGRVALITMTQHRRTGKKSFRLDCTLPLASEDEMNIRPQSSLLGIAAGPIQGQETGSEGDGSGNVSGSFVNPRVGGRRFRLILTYHDTSFISYEIWRSVGMHDGDGLDGELCVF